MTEERAAGTLDKDEPGLAGSGLGHYGTLLWQGHWTRARTAGGGWCGLGQWQRLSARAVVMAGAGGCSDGGSGVGRNRWWRRLRETDGWGGMI